MTTVIEAHIRFDPTLVIGRIVLTALDRHDASRLQETVQCELPFQPFCLSSVVCTFYSVTVAHSLLNQPCYILSLSYNYFTVKWYQVPFDPTVYSLVYSAYSRGSY